MVSPGYVPHCVGSVSARNWCLTEGICQEALDIERSNGDEGVEGKYRKDKGLNLQYRPGPPANFRKLSMHCLS